jgi:hypothetical protein
MLRGLTGLSDWRLNTTTQQQQDVGYGVRILSAGAEYPRLITSMSVYSGTNTVACTMRYFILPSQPGSNPNAYNISAGEQMGAQLFHNTGNLSSGTSPQTGFGILTDRGGAPFLILPPGYILVATPSDNNSDGTIIHSVVSCELV